MRTHQITLLGLSVLLIGFSGCATIIKGGGSQSIQFKSDPPGAKCAIFDNVTGNTLANITTPGIVPLKRGSGYFQSAKYNINCSMDNNTSQEGIIEGNVNIWYIGGNILLGGLIGYVVVDPLTGAMWNLEPEEFVVNFVNPGKSVLKKAVALENASESVRK